MLKSMTVTLPRAVRGMSLIELLVAVAIVGILAAIAYPSYRQQVMRSARSDGKVELMRAAQSLEKCFTLYGAYNNANCAVLAPLNQGMPSEGGRYLVSSVAVQAATYQLQAVPQGGQAEDTRCANLTLDSTGLRGHSGTAEAANECW